MNTRLTFHGQHQDEIVVLLQRRHWSLLLGRCLRWVMLGLVPGIAQLIVNQVADGFTFDVTTTTGVLLVLGASAYLLIIIMLGFQDWVDYELDTLILTNERVLRIEQSGMFNRVVSQLTLDRIQDVTIETKGIFSTIFGFGRVTIETAGEQEHFVFDHLPHVESVQTQILQYARQTPRQGVERSRPTEVKISTDKPE